MSQADIDDTALGMLSQNCHKLEHLSLFWCDSNVSKQGVEKFITASPKLKYLDIRYGDNIIDPGYAIRIEQEHPNIKIVHQHQFR